MEGGAVRRHVIVPALIVAFASASYSQTPRSIWDGLFTYEQAARGEATYLQHCASCHGEALDGLGPAPPLPIASRPTRPLRPIPLAGREFRSNWHEMSVGDLFERIRISMPQQAPGSLSRAQNADITAYILRVNGYPTGPEELSGEMEKRPPVTFIGW
jgi:mono/diheme cytochrome c family protein